MTDAPEIIETTTTTVACDGRGQNNAPGRPGDLGHPEVYLNMGGAREVQCPYCSRLFVLRPGASGATGH